MELLDLLIGKDLSKFDEIVEKVECEVEICDYDKLSNFEELIYEIITYVVKHCIINDKFIKRLNITLNKIKIRHENKNIEEEYKYLENKIINSYNNLILLLNNIQLSIMLEEYDKIIENIESVDEFADLSENVKNYEHYNFNQSLSHISNNKIKIIKSNFKQLATFIPENTRTKQITKKLTILLNNYDSFFTILSSKQQNI